MGLNIFVNGTNSHTRRVPMSVSSGLKRSHRVSKCHETLGAKHIRASHMVSQCHETFGAERIRALHKVSKCRGALGAHARATFGHFRHLQYPLPPSSSHTFPTTNKDSQTTTEPHSSGE